MATNGWAGVTEADIATKIARRGKNTTQPKDTDAELGRHYREFHGGASEGTTLPQGKSKYRNVKCVVSGEKFDSQREADVWLGLLARQSAGEISELKRQVPFPLYAPQMCVGQAGDDYTAVQVAEYRADFTYLEAGKLVVTDAKGMKTQVYRLKKRWLELQEGIEIVEV